MNVVTGDLEEQMLSKNSRVIFWGLGLKYDKIKPVLCGECSVEKVQDL